jgi:NADPH:quinone reductase-like Zn-dependent oxidoreductase
MEKRIEALTGGTGVPFALDAVGGATGSAVARALAPGGRMLVYGTLAEEPLLIDPRTLMAGQKSIVGFWLSEWVRGQGVLTMLQLFRRIRKLMATGVLGSEIEASFSLNEIQAAVRRAAEPGRHGKVLLRMKPA